MTNHSKKYVIGIDLGGTKISTAIADSTGHIIEKTTLATGAKDGEFHVMNRMISSVEQVLEASGLPLQEVAAIGVGAPGPLDADRGAIITTPNLPFRNYSITEPLVQRFGVPAFLDNDGNVAAIGEWLFGQGKGCQNLIYLTVSTGVGGGAVLSGRPFHGSTSNALEVGHMTLDPSSPHRCNCGNYGDVEALCSGTALSKRAMEAIAQGRETSLSKHRQVTTYEIYEAYKEGDPLAREILTTSWRYLGIAVANLILTFDPDVIAIGGGVSRIGDAMFEAVRASARAHAFEFMVDRVRIVPTGLAQDTGVLGAIALALVRSQEGALRESAPKE
ncbi:putative ROK-family transcriptional regulator [Clostridiaceae bacterium JG1575]|nr:putative ROK-family transcriptional regulator [Clostridiaceae bacterium JG1575]